MLNFGASKPRVRGGPSPRGPPWIRTWVYPSMHWVGSVCIPACTRRGCLRRGCLSGGCRPPWEPEADIPPGTRGRHPHPRRPLQRTVRILLEFILVLFKMFSFKCWRRLFMCLGYFFPSCIHKFWVVIDCQLKNVQLRLCIIYSALNSVS